MHGWSNNRSFWEPHFSAYARMHPVVALDLAGFGESGTDRSLWSMRAFGQDVNAVLEDLQLHDAVLVGFSMGAGAVLEAAVQHPERVRGVVFVDWLHDPDFRYGRDYAAGMSDFAVKNWHRPGFFPPDSLLEPFPDSLVARYERGTPGALPQHWQAIGAELFRWADEDLVPDLKRLRVPLAAINSSNPVTNVAAYQRYAPGFQVRLMPRRTHLGVIWQDTEGFDRHLAELIAGMSRPAGETDPGA